MAQRSRSSSQVDINMRPLSSSVYDVSLPSQQQYLADNNNDNSINPSALDLTQDQPLSSPPLPQFQSSTGSSFLHPEHARRTSQPITNHNFSYGQHIPTQDPLQEFGASTPDFTSPTADFGSINPQLLNNTPGADTSFDFDSSLLSPDGHSPLESYQDTSNIPGAFNTDDMASMKTQTPSPAHMQQQYHHHPHSRQPSHASIQSSTSYNYNNTDMSQYNNHSRNPSLTPGDAIYNSNEHTPWASSPFQHPQQSIADDHSDFVGSQHPSPFLGYNSFTPSGPSPYLNPNQDQLDDLNFNQFNLADGDAQFNRDFVQNSSPYSMQHNMNGSFHPNEVGLGFAMPQQSHNSVVYPTYEQFPSLVHQDSNEMGSPSATMSPPEIAIDFAPPQKQPSFPMPLYDETLVPQTTQSARPRSATAGSSGRASSTARGRAASLTVPGAQRTTSRSTSPGGPAGVTKSSRRGSGASNINPERVAEEIAHRRRESNASNISEVSTNGGSPEGKLGSNGLKQKNPSNYHCKLCDKSFTRAYNLRSHERTHTNERPFVCNTCGKTFARQHDRKRHEQLHTGVKKFVCHGQLKDGTRWGCGKGFARADALGRHFKSEQGRTCIAPLFGEEAQERQQDMVEQQQHRESMNQQAPHQLFVPTGASVPQIQVPNMPIPSGLPALPASLLQMYPALADLQWGTIGTGSGQPGDDDYASNMEGSDFEEYMSGSELEEHDYSNGNVNGMPSCQHPQQYQSANIFQDVSGLI